MTPEERYQRDNLFRTMVDQFELYIRAAVFSGTEIREAAMLALIHYEATTLRSYVIHPGGLEQIDGGKVRIDPDGRVVSLLTRLDNRTRTIEELREAVARGAGHECVEWIGVDASCALCGRPSR